jgi:hypothetical protein
VIQPWMSNTKTLPTPSLQRSANNTLVLTVGTKGLRAPPPLSTGL